MLSQPRQSCPGDTGVPPALCLALGVVAGAHPDPPRGTQPPQVAGSRKLVSYRELSGTADCFFGQVFVKELLEVSLGCPFSFPGLARKGCRPGSEGWLSSKVWPRSLVSVTSVARAVIDPLP